MEKLLFQSILAVVYLSVFAQKAVWPESQEWCWQLLDSEVQAKRLLRLHFLQFRNILKIKLFLSFTDLEKVIRAFISSGLDKCKSHPHVFSSFQDAAADFSLLKVWTPKKINLAFCWRISVTYIFKSFLILQVLEFMTSILILLSPHIFSLIPSVSRLDRCDMSLSHGLVLQQ